VQESVPGLNFIKQLRPVTYHYNTKKFDEFKMKNFPDSIKAKRMQTEKEYNEASSPIYTGFIAQEVEASAKKIGFDFSGVDKPKNADDVSGLRYAEFVVPLVKSVQELNAINEAQQAKMNEYKTQIEKQNDDIQFLKNELEKLKTQVASKNK
jgi:hypothetical protein